MRGVGTERTPSILWAGETVHESSDSVGDMNIGDSVKEREIVEDEDTVESIWKESLPPTFGQVVDLDSIYRSNCVDSLLAQNLGQHTIRSL